MYFEKNCIWHHSMEVLSLSRTRVCWAIVGMIWYKQQMALRRRCSCDRNFTCAKTPVTCWEIQYMGFASTLQNIRLIKLDTAWCSSLMTTFTQARILILKVTMCKTNVNHIYFRVSRDATREGSNTVARENDFHWAMSNTVLRKIQTPMIDCKRLAIVLLSGRYLTIL